MMDILLTTDHQLFLAINHLPHTLITDWLALIISGVGVGGLIWFLLAVVLFVREETKDHRFFVPILATLGICWIFVELILKYIVSRERPTPDIGAVIVGNGTGWFSFPSSHATVAFAMAIVLSRYEPRWRTALFILAVVISLSRIYLGVHYPIDVFAGALLGTLIGHTVLRYVPSPRRGNLKRRTERR